MNRDDEGDELLIGEVDARATIAAHIETGQWTVSLSKNGKRITLRRRKETVLTPSDVFPTTTHNSFIFVGEQQPPPTPPSTNQ